MGTLISTASQAPWNCRSTRASNAETQLLGKTARLYSVAMGQIPRSTERIFSFQQTLTVTGGFANSV